jgi:hypothetical protein
VTRPQSFSTCPRCRSQRVHRSHRRSKLDKVLYALGGDIRRCHDCQARYVGFKTFTLPLPAPHSTTAKGTSAGIMGSGFVLCLVLVLWMIRRFTELSG